jgi:hypothetical protein
MTKWMRAEVVERRAEYCLGEMSMNEIEVEVVECWAGRPVSS